MARFEILDDAPKARFEIIDEAPSSVLSDIKQGAGNVGAGLLRGAGSIGATLLAPVDAAVRKMNNGKPLEVTVPFTDIQVPLLGNERRQAMDDGLQSMGAQPDSLLYGAGKLGGEIAGTMGVGSALGVGARAVGAAPSIVNALTTSGMRAGSTPGAVNMLTRMAGGATAGGVSAGLIDPKYAGTGAVIGGALPPALAGAGKVGGAIGRAVSGQQALPGVRDAVKSARSVGYVIPPSQAKPTLGNRALEGFAGKLSTAQNASAKNQSVTNNLAMKSIGASELSEAGLKEVRRNANAAYTQLGNAGKITTDDAYRAAIQKAGTQSARFADDFPELVSKDVDDLLGKFTGKESFDAGSAIEAIKRLREGQRAGMKAFDNAERKALAKVQGKIASALEEVVERNLEKSGSVDLLTSFRNARQTLAKVYDVEKALNSTSGNIDASKIAAALKKGRPLTGELRQIGDFSAQFPKATQSVDKMGSLPGISPLDFGVGAIGTAAGNPLAFLLGPARMGARALALSGPVQNRLPSQAGNLQGILSNPASQQLLYRSGPALGPRR